VDRKHWGWFTVVSFVGVYLNQVFFVYGIQLAGAVLASVGQLATPPITSILAVIFKLEKFSWTRFAGVVLSVIGGIVLLGLDQSSLSGNRTLGIVLVMTRPILVASFYLLQRAKLLPQYVLFWLSLD
jgi:drug/metabolite transporter (DMT)-like permease